MTDMCNIFLKATNCASLACFRNVSTATIADANANLILEIPSSGWASPGISYGPVIDGNLVPDLPATLLKKSLYHQSAERIMAANMVGDGMF
jgi:hypothetical protein